ncbi:helix-turn-helix domain-containing protein [Patescibacteria group bacterium]|nr:helix-turn-helix domain-containing protein [Patescibacteria group bacterium]
MAKFADRERALALRKKEMSYSQIKKILKVSKGTLSIWLKDYPLSKQRIRELRDCNEQRIERYRETMRRKKEKRLDIFYAKQKKNIFPINKRELYIAGLFLYWGEGSKTPLAHLSISNTDPSVIKFFLNWFKRVLKIPKEKLRFYLQLYSNMNIDKEITFWSKILNVPKNQFSKPYIKNSSSTRINHRGSFGHGTCNITLGSARISEQVSMAIKAISDKFNRARS